MNILFPQTLNKFSSHRCSVHYGTIFFFKPMICSFVVHLDYDGNDHFRERLQVDCVFFSTKVDLFKNRNSISPFKTVITGVPLVLASTL